MKIYGTIDPEQFLLSDELKRAEVLFLGDNRGVALFERGPNDKHVVVKILGEDDGNWFVAQETFSWFWVQDLRNQLDLAQMWLEKHAVKDGNFGYRFK